jgi:hypothetical protein
MKKLWELAEDLTQKVFKLNPVSGSGRGPFGKGDAKDDYYQVDTKSTEKGSFSVKREDFRKYRLQAARERKTFFLHLIFCEDNKMTDDRYVIIHERDFLPLFEALPNE